MRNYAWNAKQYSYSCRLKNTLHFMTFTRFFINAKLRIIHNLEIEIAKSNNMCAYTNRAIK